MSLFYVVFILCVIFFHINLSIGFHIIRLNPRHKTHITLFLFQVILALGNLGFIIFQLSNDEKTFLLLFQHLTSVSSLFHLFIVLVAFRISNVFKLKIIHYLILSIPCIIAAVLNSSASSFAEVVYYNNSWRLVKFISPIVYVHICNYLLFVSIYIGICIFWFRKTSYKREKKQALVLLITAAAAVLTYIVYMVIGIVSLKIIKYEIAGSSHLSTIVWTLGFWYCLVKYRLLAITPELASRDIIENIDESIILLDNRYQIITGNSKTKTLINHIKIEEQNISEVIMEHQKITQQIEHIISGEIDGFSCRLNYLGINNNKILMDTKFTSIKDKFNENIGILIIGREVKELKQLKTLYKLTDREGDILQHLINGSTTKELSDNFNITISTIKTHLTNIYNKLGVDNKIQLFQLLKDYKLISDKSSEKIVIITN